MKRLDLIFQLIFGNTMIENFNFGQFSEYDFNFDKVSKTSLNHNLFYRKQLKFVNFLYLDISFLMDYFCDLISFIYLKFS